VCTAIGVGGDTDSMAAIAGAIGGARGGVSALPRQLVASLNDRGEWRAPELIDLACDCARIVTASRVLLPLEGAGRGVILAGPISTDEAICPTERSIRT
jgi:hypothetical protein